MYDLSWLNPTPHAIAVYASQPPSPVATQHSLPSGRYSLLGPDFHRLDRTSFAWRTHSITSSASVSSLSGIWRPSALAVLRLITNSSFVACMTGRSAGFSPLTARVESDLSVRLCDARSVTDEFARHYELTKRVHSRNCVVCRKFNEPLNPGVEKKSVPTSSAPVRAWTRLAKAASISRSVLAFNV